MVGRRACFCGNEDVARSGNFILGKRGQGVQLIFAVAPQPRLAAIGQSGSPHGLEIGTHVDVSYLGRRSWIQELQHRLQPIDAGARAPQEPPGPGRATSRRARLQKLCADYYLRIA